MKWKGSEVPVSRALWRQEIGLEPVGEQLWAVHFENVRLGTFHEKKGIIERCVRLLASSSGQPNENN